MTIDQAHEILSGYRTREIAVQADDADDWDKAWHITSMADYDEQHGIRP